MQIFPDNWHYVQAGKRDLRIDVLRGIVMVILVIVHIDFFSLYNLFVWERIGIISGAEGFVILSGFVVGMLYGKRLKTSPLHEIALRLWKRAIKLYRANIAVIVSVAFLSLLPFGTAQMLMTFTDPYTKTVYPLYPQPGIPFPLGLWQLARLQFGPHQFQIMGLYVVLLFCSPLVLWMLKQRLVVLVVAASWGMYLLNIYAPSMPTGAQFEYAFPLLTWQVLYIHGMVCGYYHKQLASLFDTAWKRPILIVSGILFFGFMLFAWNSPNPELPEFARLSFIAPETFSDIYFRYCQKNTLGILRLINYAAALVFGSYILTRFWLPVHRGFGWLLIPLGQHSLYVFIMHIFVLYIIGNIGVFWQGNTIINTLGHTAALLLLWILVQKRFLFEYVPH